MNINSKKSNLDIQDEVDLNTLLLSFFKYKIFIVTLVTIGLISSSIYCLFLPDIYIASSTLTINSEYNSPDSINITNSSGNFEHIKIEKNVISLLSSRSVLEQIKNHSNVKLVGLKFNYNPKTKLTTVTIRGKEKEEIYNIINTFVTWINTVYKENKLKIIDVSISSLAKTINNREIESTLNELYVKDLYIKELLTNPDSDFITITSQPTPPRKIKKNIVMTITYGAVIGLVTALCIITLLPILKLKK